MTAKRSAGTTISISATTPGSYDQSGYEAIGDFSPLGEATRIAGFGPRWNTESHNPLANSGTQYIKTNRDGGPLSVEMALDTDDAGQVKAKAARDSATAIYSIKITEPNGDDYYAQILVTDFQVLLDTQSAKQTATLTAVVTASDSDIDWVEVLA